MSERTRGDGVEHEPIVSETLRRNASRESDEALRSQGATREARETRERLRGGHAAEAESPGAAETRPEVMEEGETKPHGDALLEGSGNRHGVHETGERPDTCA